MYLHKLIICLLIVKYTYSTSPEEELGVTYANRCEVCKYMAVELEGRLDETGKSNDVLELGYSLDDVKPKKKQEYRKSELRLVESLDKVCDKILEYNIHKERKDSTRFAKGMSQTFHALHNLVDKGVKVDLGIPYELWDTPSAEVTNMKSQCETLLEKYEHVIEDWYFNRQGEVSLRKYLCVDNVLNEDDSKCLDENFEVKGETKKILKDMKKELKEKKAKEAEQARQKKLQKRIKGEVGSKKPKEEL